MHSLETLGWIPVLGFMLDAVVQNGDVEVTNGGSVPQNTIINSSLNTLIDVQSGFSLTDEVAELVERVEIDVSVTVSTLQARALDVRLSQQGPVSSPLWRRRSLTSTLYCIRAAFVEKFTFEGEEWDCWLVSTSTVAVRTQVARNGHRATRDVRRTTEEQALREALLFLPLWVEDVGSCIPLQGAARRH